MESTSRYTQIDIAKGIGILFVVFGHNVIVGLERGKLYMVIFSFHVPLFFFISGLLMNYSHNLLTTAIKKLDSYFKPYFVALFLMGIFSVFYQNVNPILYFLGILYGTILTIPVEFMPLWFLPHLLAVSLFSFFCYKHMNIESRSITFKVIFLLLLLVVGFGVIKYFRMVPFPRSPFLCTGLPFSIDLIFISSFYFLLGSILKKHTLEIKFNWLVFIAFALIFSFLHHYFNYTIDLGEKRYGNILISTIEALIGIYLVISVSGILNKSMIISKFLAWIGSASLIILIFHFHVACRFSNIFGPPSKDHLAIYGLMTFVLSVAIPLMFYELILKVSILKTFFLPIKYKEARFQEGKIHKEIGKISDGKRSPRAKSKRSKRSTTKR